MLSLVVATGNNRQIGLNGKLPWNIPADLQLFKQITMSHTVIMGRKTWESINKPLPGRNIVVISNNTPPKSPQSRIIHLPSVRDALYIADAFSYNDEIFVVGGESIYAQFLPHADRIYLSLIDYDGPADSYFPELNPKDWVVKSATPHAETPTTPFWKNVILERI